MSEMKKPVNTRETAAEFFRKYSDIIKEAEEVKEEAEDDEDEDVKKADKEKGKDGETQKDAEKKRWKAWSPSQPKKKIGNSKKL